MSTESLEIDGLLVEFEVDEYRKTFGSDIDGRRGIYRDCLKIDWDSVTVDGVPIDDWRPSQGDFADWNDNDFKEYRNYLLERIERSV